MFSDSLPIAERFVDLLSTDGIVRGVIGPRETPRLWSRHVLNCAVGVEAVPHGARVADVGSGAGLPGIVWSIARPDLTVTLIEPQLRRTRFLTDVVGILNLEGRVEICRDRAESHGRTYPVVTARAVADMGRLARMCLPLVERGGKLIAFKGESAPGELQEAMSTIRRVGGIDAAVTTYGRGVVSVPTTIVEVHR